jgi:subtilisin family serine protease
MKEETQIATKRDEKNTPTVEIVDLPLSDEHAQQTTGGDNGHGSHTAGTIGAVGNNLAF